MCQFRFRCISLAYYTLLLPTATNIGDSTNVYQQTQSIDWEQAIEIKETPQTLPILLYSYYSVWHSGSKGNMTETQPFNLFLR